MADDLGGQLKIQQEINKALQARGALLSAQNKQLSSQAQLYKEICSAMECEDLDGVSERLGTIQEGLRQAAADAEDAGGSIESSMNKGQKATNEAGKSVKKGILDGLSAAKVAAVGFGVGIVSGVRSAIKQIKGLAKSIGNVTKSLANVGKAVVSIPFKMMSGLIGMAQSGGGGGPNPIKVALEEIRGEFGSLASNEGQAVASALGQLKGQMNDLGGTGIKLSKVFGRGKAGLAEAMKYVSEIAKAAGPALNGLMDTFKQSAGVLAAYTKGLTGSAEGTAAILKHFKAMGDDPVEAMDAMASQAVLMGKQFGVSAKVIGKSMAEMVKDVSHFGHLSTKELAATATYAAKLGIEIKDLGAVTDKFLNFEDAAQGAAQLQQAFGMTVDSMELMKGGAAAIDELRKGFHNAGKSIKDLSAAERRLLEQQTGLNGAALDAAFAADKQGLSYAELSDAAGENEEKQLTQAEAMKELADSIQKTFGGGGGGKTFKGFFDAFVQGFTKGIKKSSEFRKVMKNIRKSLKIVYKAGKDIGKMFVKMFPGVKQMLKGLAGLFDPKHYQKLMTKVKDIFKQFFKDVATDPKAGTEKFIERMKAAFKEFFGDRKGAASELKKGMSTFAKTMGAILKVLGMLALKGITKLFHKLADKIRNPPEVPAGVKELKEKLGAAMIEMFTALKEKYLPPVIEALKGFFLAIWEKVKPHVEKAGKFMLKLMITRIIFTAVMSAIKGGLVTTVVKAIAGFFGKVFGIASKIQPIPPSAQGSIGGLKGFFTSLGGVGSGEIAKAAGKLLLITTVFVPAFLLFVNMAVLGIYQILSGVNIVEFIGMMVGLAIAVGTISLFLKALIPIKAGDIGSAMTKLPLLALLMGIGVASFAAALVLTSSIISRLDAETIVTGMIAIAVAVGAAMLMTKAGAQIQPGEIMKAAGGVLAAAALVLAAIPFAMALMVMAPVVGQMTLGEAAGLAAAFVAMAIIATALYVMIKATIKLQPAMLIPAMLGLVVAAVLVAVGGIAFTLALAAVGAVMEGVGFEKIALGFVMMAVAALALVAITASVLLVGAQALAAMVPMLLTAVFLVALAHIFIPALRHAGENMGDIPWKELGLAFLKLVPVAIGLALIAPLIAIAGVLALFGLIGLLPASLFLYALSDLFIPAVGDFVAAPGFDKLAGAKTGFEALDVLFNVLKKAAIASMLLLPFAFPFMFWLLEAGLEVVGDFIKAMAKYIIPPAETMAKMKVSDPKAFKNNMEALSGLMETVALLGEVAVDLAEIELEAIEEGGANASVLGPVKDFMEVLFKGVGDMITVIVDAMKNVSPAQIKVATAIGDVLSAIGTLMGNIMGPMVDVVKMAQESNTKGIFFTSFDKGGFSKTMEAVGGFINTIMCAMKDNINGMVKAVIEAKVPEGKNAEITAKIKIIKGVMDAMSVFADIAGKMVKQAAEAMEAHEKSRTWWDKVSGGNKAKFSDMMDQMGEVMTMLGDKLSTAIPKILTAMITAVDKGITDPESFGKKIDVIAKLIEVMGGTLEGIGKAMDLVERFKGNDSLTDTIDWLFVDGGPWADEAMVLKISKGIGEGIKAIADEIDKLPNPDGLKPKMEMAALAIKISGKFIDSIAKVMDIMPDPAQSTNMYTQLFTILDIIYFVSREIAFVLPRLVGSIIGINVGDPATTKAKLEVVSIVMKVIGDFTKAIEKLMKLMPKSSTMSELNNNVEQFFGGGGVMFKIIRRLMGGNGYLGVPQLVKAIVDGAKIITNPALAKQQMEVVSSAMGAVADFASAIAAVMSLAPAGKDAEFVTEVRLSSILATVSRVSASIGEHLPAIVDKVKGAADKITNPAAMSKKMDALGKMMGAVASFAEAIASVMSLAPTSGDTVKETQLRSVLATVSRVSDSIGEHLPKLATSIVNLFKRGGDLRHLRAYKNDIKALATVFEAVGKFVEAIKKLKEMEVSAGGTDIKVLLSRLTGIIVDNKATIVSLVKSFGGIRVSSRFPKDAFKNFGEFIDGGLTPFVEAMNRMPEMTTEKLATLQADFTKLKNSIRAAGNARTLRDAVRVTENLGKTGTVKVEGIPDKIELKIEVKLSADQLATKLSNTGKLVVNTSDRRLKEDIEHVGVSDSGINIYEFCYLYDTGTRWRGVMAQELLETHPEAVFVDEKGYYAVQYDKIDVDFEKV